MSEFEDRLNSILNDPAQMEKITAMAKNLMGQREEPREPPVEQVKRESDFLGNFDPALLGRLSGMLGSGGRSDEKRALLEAMKPYLSPARREKLDKAMKLAKMIGMAEIAFGALGGDHAKI